MFWRWLFALAVLLMPFGMTAAPANAHGAPAASVAMQHCPEQAPSHDTQRGLSECTMACSAALPAADVPQEEHVLAACVPTERAAAQKLHGLDPDIATPPPRAS